MTRAALLLSSQTPRRLSKHALNAVKPACRGLRETDVLHCVDSCQALHAGLIVRTEIQAT